MVIRKIGAYSAAGPKFSAKKNIASGPDFITNAKNKSKPSAVPPQLLPAYRIKQPNFRGTPFIIPAKVISGAADAIAQWDLLRFAKYSDVHDDSFAFGNKAIRAVNYSFLDSLSSQSDKRRFVEYFRNLTGFPDLGAVAKKIDKHFSDVLHSAERNLTCSNNMDNNYQVVLKGYDPTCSVSLGAPFPGSDLDKAYVMLIGQLESEYIPRRREIASCPWPINDYLSDTEAVSRFKGELWDEVDQRIFSLNHRETFPEVLTFDQFHRTLDFLDEKTKELIAKNGEDRYLRLIGSDIVDPMEAAQFNIDLSKKLSPYPSYSGAPSKYAAKNFAFFLEGMRENEQLQKVLDYIRDTEEYGFMYYRGKGRAPWDYASGTLDSLGELCYQSPFFRLSNAAQIPAWKKRLKTGYRKQKLLNRMELYKKFDSMGRDEQYELVKDIIKYSSGDQSNPKFERYFRNDDDIKERFTPLIQALTE